MRHDPIDISLWGKDHWSTLLYIECKCVDGRGIMPAGDEHMRKQNPNYPTRLNDGSEVEWHSDWDCMEDMATAGLLTKVIDDQGDFIHITLTDYGWLVAGLLRRHRAEGKGVKSFVAPAKQLDLLP